MLPKFLIVGAMRSGTSALSRFVNAHPRVFVPPRKEMHFFDHGMDKGLGWYESHFEAAREGSVPGEATPGYLYFPGTAQRIADTLPDVKLVAILRNPVDRAYSHYWHNRRREIESRPFEQAVADERQGRSAQAAGEPYRFAYLDRGHYVDQLKTYEAIFPRDRLFVLLNRDLRNNRDATVQQVWDHIGAGRPNRTLEELLATRGKPSLLQRARRLLGGKKPSGGRPEWFDYPKMDPGIRTELLTYFEPDVTAAEKWLGESLPHWRT